MKYTKSDAGQQAFKDRSPLISARQRSVFILFDGDKTVETVLSMSQGFGVTQADVDHLVVQGFLEALPGGLAAGAELDVDLEGPALAPEKATKQWRYAKAMPIATQLTAGIGLRGFSLNLAVEAASGYDDLLALLPKIKEAVGPRACQELQTVLTG